MPVTEPGALATTGDTRQAAVYRRAFEATLGIAFTDGNSVETLLNGCRIFPAMLAAIEGARESIEFLTFIYGQGEIAVRFGRALGERAQAGVRVRVLLDWFGAYSMSRQIVAQMQADGVELAWFRPAVRWRLWQANNRTHRKILLVDGRVGFTGGVGVAAKWQGDARNPREWRDTHFRLTGPVLDGLRGAFLSNWIEAGRRGFDDRYRFAAPGTRGGASIQVLRTSAAVNYTDIATLFRLVVCLARRRLRIATGYFVPDDAMIESLCRAARAGVDIEVLMPGRYTDSRVSRAAGEAVYAPLLAAGVKLYRYQPTMLHVKIMLLDETVAVVGSANFNHRSMGKDDEIALTVLHAPTFARLAADFDADRARCQAVDARRWRRRSRWRRAQEWMARRLRFQA